MGHKIILITIFSIVFIITLFHLIKNKPQYLVLLGIRGLFSYFFLQFMNYICGLLSLSSVVLANPISLTVGALLGFPGLLLLYLTKIYLL